MAKIKFGDRFDKSESDISIHTSGTSASEFVIGSGHDESKLNATIDESHAAPKGGAPTPGAGPASGSAWNSGSFYLAVFVVISLVLLAWLKLLPGAVVPLAVAGTVVILVIIGTFELRRSGKMKEKTFGQIVEKSLSKIFSLLHTKK